MTYKAKKIQSGLYEYRGHSIEKRLDNVWSWGLIYVDEDGFECADMQDASNSLTQAKDCIDQAFDQQNNLKNLDWLINKNLGNDKIKLINN